MLYVVNKSMLCNLVDFKGIYAVLARIETYRKIRAFVLFFGLKYSSVLFCTLFPSLQVRMMMTPQLRMAMFFTMGRSVRKRLGPSVEMPRKYAKWFT